LASLFLAFFSSFLALLPSLFFFLTFSSDYDDWEEDEDLE
jgi:hypothetical protein